MSAPPAQRRVDMEGGVAGRQIADQPIPGAVQRIAGIHLRLGDGGCLVGRHPGPRLVVKRLSQKHAVQLQGREIVDRMDGDDAVIIGGITLHRFETFVTALAVALEIHPARPLAVMLPDQKHGDVMGFLDLVAAEIAQGLGVGREGGGVLARFGLVGIAVAAECGIALAQRQGLFGIGEAGHPRPSPACRYSRRRPSAAPCCSNWRERLSWKRISGAAGSTG